MKLNLPDVTNVSSVATINSNFAAIEQELQNNVLYRNNPGAEPNTLEDDLDVNGKDLYNVGNVRTSQLYLDGQRVLPVGVITVEGEQDISHLLVKNANLEDVQDAAMSRYNLGLGNVNNTADSAKPISAATSSALLGKQSTLVSGTNIKTVNGNSLLGGGNLTIAGGGGGESNTASNLGAGEGLATTKVGEDLPFKSLVAGTNITLTPSSTDVTIGTSGLQTTLVSGTSIRTINGTSVLGSGDIVVSGGSSDFTQAGTGAVTKTMQNKVREFISVKDFGAIADGATDASTAFQNAIDLLPAAGGRIVVPDGAYVLNTTPDTSAITSIYWDIGTGCTFTGTGTGIGKFPYNATNTAQMAVGPLIQSRSPEHSLHPNGGIQTLGVEMHQPDGYGAGQSVAIYAGAYSNNSNAAGNVWALNTLINAGPSAGGTYQCIEVDVDCESATAYMKGISISGGGAHAPDIGLEIVRAGTPKWDRGIHILNSTIGLKIDTDTSVTTGIKLGEGTTFSDTPFCARQNTTSQDALVLQRSAGGAGNVIRLVDEANTTNLFQVLGTGAVISQGFSEFYGGMGTTAAVITAGAFTVPAGNFCLGNSTAATASAGGETLPSNPAGFWAFFIGSTVYKIPYYNN